MGEFLRLLLHTWGQVATIDPSAEVLHGTHRRWSVAIGIAAVAALSGMVGRLGLLVINRVRGLGVLVAAGLSITQLLVAHIVEGLLLWGLTALVLGDAPSVGVVVRVLLLSAAPLWWSWLAITPFIGMLIERLLWAWTLATSWALMIHLLPGRSQWLVLAVVLGAWLVARVVATALNHPVHWVRNAIWKRLTGRPLRVSAAELLAEATPYTLAAEHSPPLANRTAPERPRP